MTGSSGRAATGRGGGGEPAGGRCSAQLPSRRARGRAARPAGPAGHALGIATVSQHKVVTAIRACEVMADPTNALALEAAVPGGPAHGKPSAWPPSSGWSAPSGFPVGWSAHFGLFAMVTAGRDQGSRPLRAGRRRRAASLRRRRPESRGRARRPGSADAPVGCRGADRDRGRSGPRDEVPAEVVTDHDRVGGRGYYRDLCFKVNALVDDGPAEIGDGGFTDWTAALLANAKERLPAFRRSGSVS